MRARSWLPRRPNPEATARLFCFPFAGVGASAYRQWPTQIGDLEVCPVQLPGRENRMREPTYQTFEAFAEDAAEGLLAYFDRPFAFFGHCMGALLGYALLVKLAENKQPLPARYYASSSLVPHEGFFGPYHPRMSDETLIGELRKIIRMFGNEEPMTELLQLSVRILRKDVEMCFGYCPTGPRQLPCPISTIAWSNDPDVSAQEMVRWSEYGQVNRHVLMGDNFTVVTAPASLLQGIQTDFQQTDVRAGSP